LPLHDDDTNEKLVIGASQFLVANGFFEILSNSLTREHYAEQLNKKEEAVKILNPLSNDLSVMRQSTIFSGLETIQYNSNRKNPDLRFFEFGKTYYKTSSKNSANQNEIPG